MQVFNLKTPQRVDTWWGMHKQVVSVPRLAPQRLPVQTSSINFHPSCPITVYSGRHLSKQRIVCRARRRFISPLTCHQVEVACYCVLLSHEVPVIAASRRIHNKRSNLHLASAEILPNTLAFSRAVVCSCAAAAGATCLSLYTSVQRVFTCTCQSVYTCVFTLRAACRGVIFIAAAEHIDLLLLSIIFTVFLAVSPTRYIKQRLSVCAGLCACCCLFRPCVLPLAVSFSLYVWQHSNQCPG